MTNNDSPVSDPSVPAPVNPTTANPAMPPVPESSMPVVQQTPADMPSFQPLEEKPRKVPFTQSPTGKAVIVFGLLVLIFAAIGLALAYTNGQTSGPAATPTGGPVVTSAFTGTPMLTPTVRVTGTVAPTNLPGTTVVPSATPATTTQNFNTGYCEITAQIPNTWDTLFTPQTGPGAGEGYNIKFFKKSNTNYSFSIEKPDGGAMDNFCGLASQEPQYTIKVEPIIIGGNEYNILKCYVNDVFQENTITVGNSYFYLVFEYDDQEIKDIIKNLSYKNCSYNIT